MTISPAGVIFLCDDEATQNYALKRKLFGLPPKFRSLIERIRAGTTVFLFNTVTRRLYGIFRTTSAGGYELDKYAFGGDLDSGSPLPCQVFVEQPVRCMPIAEDEFFSVIKDNYYKPGKFNIKLNREQVDSIVDILRGRKPSRYPSNPPFHGDGHRNNSFHHGDGYRDKVGFKRHSPHRSEVSPKRHKSLMQSRLRLPSHVDNRSSSILAERSARKRPLEMAPVDDRTLTITIKNDMVKDRSNRAPSEEHKMKFDDTARIKAGRAFGRDDRGTDANGGSARYKPIRIGKVYVASTTDRDHASRRLSSRQSSERLSRYESSSAAHTREDRRRMGDDDRYVGRSKVIGSARTEKRVNSSDGGRGVMTTKLFSHATVTTEKSGRDSGEQQPTDKNTCGTDSETPNTHNRRREKIRWDPNVSRVHANQTIRVSRGHKETDTLSEARALLVDAKQSAPQKTIPMSDPALSEAGVQSPNEIDARFVEAKTEHPQHAKVDADTQKVVPGASVTGEGLAAQQHLNSRAGDLVAEADQNNKSIPQQEALAQPASIIAEQTLPNQDAEVVGVPLGITTVSDATKDTPECTASTTMNHSRRAAEQPEEHNLCSTPVGVSNYNASSVSLQNDFKGTDVLGQQASLPKTLTQPTAAFESAAESLITTIHVTTPIVAREIEIQTEHSAPSDVFEHPEEGGANGSAHGMFGADKKAEDGFEREEGQDDYISLDEYVALPASP